MNRVSFIFFIAVLMFSNLSFAGTTHVLRTADFALQLTVEPDYQIFRLEGGVFFGGDQEMAPILQKMEDGKNLVIDVSGFSGGNIYAIEPLIAHLRSVCSTNCIVKTFVGAKTQCSSFCVPLFMLGDERIADRDAIFGFHTSRLGIIKSGHVMRRTYEKHGVNRNWLNDNKYFFDQVDLTYRNPGQLNGSNIVSHIVSGQLLYKDFFK